MRFTGFLGLHSETDTTTKLEITSGTVENTAINENARTVYNNSTGRVNISDGMVSVTSSMAVFNQSIGAVTFSGSTVSATGTDGFAVYNYSVGVITIT